MNEKRKTRRGRTFKGGIISINRGGTIDCTIRNLSSTGARLEVASPVGIPDSFILLTKPDGIQYPCQVVWRKSHQIGVAFQKADQPTRLV
jgi:hypothetical protein